MRCLLITDRANWAYHSIAQSIKKYNDSDIKITILHSKGDEKKIRHIYKKFDRILVMGWQTYKRIPFLPRNITSVGIHSFHGWDNRKTTPEKNAIPPRKLMRFLSSFHSVNAVSKRLTNVFAKNGLKVVYTANGVDTQIFRCISRPPIGKKIIIGYSGSKAHDWRKGVSKFILPAAEKANVKVKIAMLSTNKYVPLTDMYKFYNRLDCYICASSSEGMSLSVLEAAACGRPIITTRVGGCTEIIKENETGFFVQRNTKEISDKINLLKNVEMLQKMSHDIENDIKQNWGWNKRSTSWLDFLRT